MKGLVAGVVLAVGVLDADKFLTHNIFKRADGIIRQGFDRCDHGVV